MTDQVLRYIKQLASLYFSFLLIFVFLDSIREDKIFWAAQEQAFPEFYLLLISTYMQFLFLTFFPKSLHFAAHANDFFPISML